MCSKQYRTTALPRRVHPVKCRNSAQAHTAGFRRLLRRRAARRRCLLVWSIRRLRRCSRSVMTSRLARARRRTSPQPCQGRGYRLTRSAQRNGGGQRILRRRRTELHEICSGGCRVGTSRRMYLFRNAGPEARRGRLRLPGGRNRRPRVTVRLPRPRLQEGGRVPRPGRHGDPLDCRFQIFWWKRLFEREISSGMQRRSPHWVTHGHGTSVAFVLFVVVLISEPIGGPELSHSSQILDRYSSTS